MNFYVTERPHDDSGDRYHIFSTPSYNEPGFYHQGRVADNFKNGRRKGCSKKERDRYYDGCIFGPYSNYYVKYQHDWDFEKLMFEKGNRLTSYVDLETTDRPVFKHANVYEFLTFIGFDRKLRMYVDAEGNPIKFATKF